MEQVRIAGHGLHEYLAKMQSYPQISSCEVDIGVFQGSNRSSLQLLHNRRGARHMDCLIDFFGKSNYERTINQSAFESLFLGSAPITIDICDGFWYQGVLTDIGTPRTERELITTVPYRFRVTRHRGTATTIKFTANDTRIWCESNVLKTDCVVRIPGDKLQGADNVLLALNGLQWSYAGELNGDLVLDGVNKIFTVGGRNANNAVKWTDFPYLIPGSNTLGFGVSGIVIGATAEIEYTPTFL